MLNPVHGLSLEQQTAKTSKTASHAAIRTNQGTNWQGKCSGRGKFEFHH